MSTPPQPQPGGPPPSDPYSGPYGTGYGGAVYPQPGGDTGTPQPGYGPPNLAKPDPQPGAYPYDPYGGRYGDGPPAGLDRNLPKAERPGIMVLALALLVVSALPFVLFGVLFLVLPLGPEVIPPEILDDPAVAELDLTIESVIAFVRAIGVVLVVLALIYITFAVIAFLGQNWARILVAVMTGGFAILLVFTAVTGGGAGDVVSLLIILGLLAASVAGTILLFVPPASRFFARPR